MKNGSLQRKGWQVWLLPVRTGSVSGSDCVTVMERASVLLSGSTCWSGPSHRVDRVTSPAWSLHKLSGFKTASSLFLFGLWLCSEFRPLFTVHMVYVVQASSSHTHCTVWVWLLCGPPERAGRGGSSTSRTLKENHTPDQSHSCACSKVRLRSCEPKISQYLKWNDQSTLFVCCLLASKLRGIT